MSPTHMTLQPVSGHGQRLHHGRYRRYMKRVRILRKRSFVACIIPSGLDPCPWRQLRPFPTLRGSRTRGWRHTGRFASLADILAEDRQKYLLLMVMGIVIAHAKSTCACVVVLRRDIDARCARWRHSPSACIAHLARHVTLNPARPPSRRPQTMSSEGMRRGGLGVERQILVDSARRPAQPSPNQTARLPRRDTQNEQ